MVFLMLLMLGCETQPEPVKPTVVAVAPKEPVYDTRLSTPELVAAWQQKTLKLAVVVENPPEIAKYAALEAKFTMDASSVAAYLDAVEPVYDDVEEPVRQDPVPTNVKPTAESAKQLESGHQHMDAGIAYAQLGDKTSAARCIKALEQKGEWNAAALVAYEMGDKPKLFAMLDKMAEREDWDYRRRAVVSRAIADKKLALATEIATHCGWDITKGDWDKDLVAMGDPKAIRAVKERQLTRWVERVSADCRDESDVVQCEGPLSDYTYVDFGDLKIRTPRDMIVDYAKLDKAGALALAKMYLDSRYSSDECDLVFYKLIRGDAALKALYLGKVRLNGTLNVEPYESEGSVDIGEEYPRIGLRCLQSVKVLGDKDLTAAWVDYLSAAGAAGFNCKDDGGNVDWCPANKAENVALGRYVLGVPGGSLQVIDPLLYGTISTEALVAVWTELGLPMPEAALTLEKVSEVLGTVASLKHKGFEAEALKIARDAIGATAPEQLNDCLERLVLYERYRLIMAGKSEAARATIRVEIDDGRKGFEAARKQERDTFLASLYLPYEVARHNTAERGAEDTMLLTTNDEAQVLVAPMLVELQVQAPTSYEFVMRGLAEKKSRPLVDGEVKRLTEAGKTDELQALLALLPYDYNQGTWR